MTKGLLDRFGEKRVIDSPITESGFCGLTVGAALAGLHPVVRFPHSAALPGRWLTCTTHFPVRIYDFQFRHAGHRPNHKLSR